MRRIVEERDGALVYGANFSVGVQVFYRIAAAAAEFFQNLESYDAFIEEAHHKRKRDAPSGTAFTARRDRRRPSRPRGADFIDARRLHSGHASRRFRLGADQITVEHVARSREGFAAGALMAAEWIIGRKGVYEFSEVFDEIVKQSRC